MRLAMRWTGLVALGACMAAVAGAAPEDSARQVFEKHCTGCHGAAKMSGLDLRSRQTLLQGGKRGAAVLPGDPGQSLLYQAVSGTGDLKMPPGKDALSTAEISTI